jgi:hypothetical protein
MSNSSHVESSCLHLKSLLDLPDDDDDDDDKAFLVELRKLAEQAQELTSK